MLEGLNPRWVDFQRGEAEARKGRTTLETALQLLAKAEDRDRHTPRAAGDSL